MQRICIAVVTVALGAGLSAPTAAQTDKIDYVDKYEYPVFKEMDAYADSVQALRDSVTDEIRDRQEEQKEAAEEQEQKLLLDFTDIKIPASPEVNGFVDAAVVPDYDIPRKYINQHSREFRIYNGTTGDDHGIHVVGYKKISGRDWYLIKDSSSRARFGKHEGYMFFRGDFIRLKMLTFMVHQEALGGLLDKFTGASGQAG